MSLFKPEARPAKLTRLFQVRVDDATKLAYENMPRIQKLILAEKIRALLAREAIQNTAKAS